MMTAFPVVRGIWFVRLLSEMYTQAPAIPDRQKETIRSWFHKLKLYLKLYPKLQTGCSPAKELGFSSELIWLKARAWIMSTITPAVIRSEMILWKYYFRQGISSVTELRFSWSVYRSCLSFADRSVWSVAGRTLEKFSIETFRWIWCLWC